MTKSYTSRRWFAALALLLLAVPGMAPAVTLTSLKGQGLSAIYGRYAPRGDCAQGVGLTIDETGFTFRALGRTVKTSRFEYALTYLGQDYQGISSVFFPFPVSDDNYGPVIMMVNDGEKRGLIRLEADLPPGQRADPLHAALVAASPLLPCKAVVRRRP